MPSIIRIPLRILGAIFVPTLTVGRETRELREARDSYRTQLEDAAGENAVLLDLLSRGQNKNASARLYDAIRRAGRLQNEKETLQAELQAAREEIEALREGACIPHGSEASTAEELPDIAIDNHEDTDAARIRRLEEELARAGQELGLARRDNQRLRDKNEQLVGIIREKNGSNGTHGAREGELPEIAVGSAVAEPEFEKRPDNFPENSRLIEWQLAGQSLTIPVPESLADIKPWADQYLQDRVELLPRAVNEARRAVYEDVRLVYQALLLLGNYRDMMANGGLEIRAYFESKRQELRLECANSIRNQNSRSTVKDYQVSWQGGVRFLDRALKKGVSHDPRRTLRVYFFYDNKSSKVVVGHLPTHLRNQLS